MLEFLKTIATDEQMVKIMEKLGDKTLNINDGSFIPRDRLNAKTEENKELTDRLAERDKQLKEIGVKVTDNDELSKRILELQGVNETQKTEYEGKISKQALENAFDKKMAALTPKNAKAAKALFDMAKISLDGENLIGFDEQAKPILEANAFLFGEDVVVGNAPPNASSPANLLNAEGKLRASYQEATKNHNTLDAIRIKQEAFKAGVKL